MWGWLVNRKNLLMIAAAVGTFAILLTEELALSDMPFTPWLMLSEALDLAMLVGATATTAALMLRVRRQEEQGVLLQRDLDLVRARSGHWSREMAGRLRELGAAIQVQFEAWNLTPAEQEVGLLMLKGFSHKEIARLRAVSEPTIRQQAASIYQKANLGGRAALSAFFLEDLLLPNPPSLPNGLARDEWDRRLSA
jgi:DNA-binding NarL/FixJ family response regulator